MNTQRIALYPGDGIGPEVTEQTVRVLEHVQQRLGGFRLQLTSLPWGVDYYQQHGVVAPADYLKTLAKFDAIFLGAVGWPQRLPDHITLKPLVTLRQHFDQYACVRPAKRRPGVRSPLVDPGLFDMIILRENTEGEYFSCGGTFKAGCDEEVAIQTAVHTRKGIRRILRFGFELAMSRTKRLTLITKSNAQRYGFVLWDQVLEELTPQFPEVETDKQHVDRASMNFVLRPSSFDVVVASNLFGDILTDLSGAVVGSLGLNPSVNLDPERRHPSMFEPVHGSAPDIAGQGIANPVAAVLSAGMMLDWLGLKEPGAAIESAVESALAAGQGTPDLGGGLSTVEMTERIMEGI